MDERKCTTQEQMGQTNERLFFAWFLFSYVYLCHGSQQIKYHSIISSFHYSIIHINVAVSKYSNVCIQSIINLLSRAENVYLQLKKYPTTAFESSKNQIQTEKKEQTKPPFFHDSNLIFYSIEIKFSNLFTGKNTTKLLFINICIELDTYFFFPTFKLMLMEK